MTEEIAGISRWWFTGPGGRSSILNSQFSIIDAGGRLGLLGRGTRGPARAVGIQNAELELGGPRTGHHKVGHHSAELELGGPRAGGPRMGGAELGVGPTTFLRYECVHMRAGPAVPWSRPDDYRTADLELF